MGATGRKRVALISAFGAPFIDDDADILSSGPYEVTRLTGSGPAAFLKAACAAPSADIVFGWFLSVYGAIAVLTGSLLGRRSLLVIGGVDVARDGELGYGLWLSPWKSFLGRLALRRADIVLVVAERLRDDAMRLAGYDGRNIRYLPTGYDAGFWTPETPAGAAPPGGPRPGTVLCVAAVDDPVRAKVKGIDVLLGAARLLPAVSFTIVGVDATLAGSMDPPGNVSFIPPTDRHGLLPYYRGAKVYCQPSRREGLPNALCEAMLCGCVPVVTDVGASAHAAGETGFVTVAGDPDALASAIGRALDAPAVRGASARERVAALFPADRRRTELLAIMRQLSDE
jgi:glycosyltransferase involved in cell wall biosynthesis